MSRRSSFTVERLAWRDHLLAEVALPKRTLRITLGLGSGLATLAGDRSGRLWAIGDRGPNLKVRQAISDFGLDHLVRLADVDGAKIMPRPDIGPTIAELRIEGDAVRFIRALPLRGPSGRTMSGLPLPGGGEAEMEPAFDLDGHPIPPDGGADTEALAVLADGGFWVADEYGPSLMRVDASGVVLRRWAPHGAHGASDPPLEPILPAIAGRRRLNRGFEALSISADEAWLFASFQSPLQHEDEDARARHLRIWKIDATSGVVVAQYVYPLDAPSSFDRDRREGKVRRADLKVCETAWLADDRLLVLERISGTTKIYRIDLAGPGTPAAHLALDTRPTLEEMTPKQLARAGVPVLAKTLVFTTDDAPQIAADLEGMAVLSDRQLILVNDNDYGTEGAETKFYRVTFDEPALA